MNELSSLSSYNDKDGVVMALKLHRKHRPRLACLGNLVTETPASLRLRLLRNSTSSRSGRSHRAGTWRPFAIFRALFLQ